MWTVEEDDSEGIERWSDWPKVRSFWTERPEGRRRWRATCDFGPEEGRVVSLSTLTTAVNSLTLQSDESLRLENLEVDLLSLVGIPLLDVLADPGDVDVRATSVRDEVEAAGKAPTARTLSVIVTSGERPKPPYLSSPHRVIMQSSRMPPCSFRRTLRVEPKGRCASSPGMGRVAREAGRR